MEMLGVVCVVLVDAGVGMSGVVAMDARTVNAKYEVAVMSRLSSGVSEAGCPVCMRKRGGRTYR